MGNCSSATNEPNPSKPPTSSKVSKSGGGPKRRASHKHHPKENGSSSVAASVSDTLGSDTVIPSPSTGGKALLKPGGFGTPQSQQNGSATVSSKKGRSHPHKKSPNVSSVAPTASRLLSAAEGEGPSFISPISDAEIPGVSPTHYAAATTHKEGDSLPTSPPQHSHHHHHSNGGTVSPSHATQLHQHAMLHQRRDNSDSLGMDESPVEQPRSARNPLFPPPSDTVSSPTMGSLVQPLPPGGQPTSFSSGPTTTTTHPAPKPAVVAADNFLDAILSGDGYCGNDPYMMMDDTARHYSLSTNERAGSLVPLGVDPIMVQYNHQMGPDLTFTSSINTSATNLGRGGGGAQLEDMNSAQSQAGTRLPAILAAHNSRDSLHLSDDDGEMEPEEHEALMKSQLALPERLVDCTPIYSLLQRAHAGTLQVNALDSPRDAFRSKLKFRDIDGWLAELGLVPSGAVLTFPTTAMGMSNTTRQSPLTSSSHANIARAPPPPPGHHYHHGANAAPLSFNPNHPHHNDDATSSSGFHTNSNSYCYAGPGMLHACNSGSLSGLGASAASTGPNAANIGSMTRLTSKALENNQRMLLQVKARARPAGNMGVDIPPAPHNNSSSTMLSPGVLIKHGDRRVGPEQQATSPIGGAYNSTGNHLNNSFDDMDEIRKASVASSMMRNRVPDRSQADRDVGMVDFYEELEEEERRMSTVKDSSSDESF